MYCKTRRTLNTEGVTLTVHGNRVGSVMRDSSSTPAKLRALIQRHKPELLQELREHKLVRISGEKFYGPGLMADAAERNHNLKLR